ncbi:MAG: hypothetical protein WAR57_09480 [Candidatus Phosphoribacter sp.]|nr:hypothetical protein [Actinomycetales bacterium]
MFTLEDIDLHACLAAMGAAHPELFTGKNHPTPEADATLHPRDYFVVGA